MSYAFLRYFSLDDLRERLLLAEPYQLRAQNYIQLFFSYLKKHQTLKTQTMIHTTEIKKERNMSHYLKKSFAKLWKIDRTHRIPEIIINPLVLKSNSRPALPPHKL